MSSHGVWQGAAVPLPLLKQRALWSIDGRSVFMTNFHVHRVTLVVFIHVKYSDQWLLFLLQQNLQMWLAFGDGSKKIFLLVFDDGLI